MNPECSLRIFEICSKDGALAQFYASQYEEEKRTLTRIDGLQQPKAL
jgi:hypothetical protein